MKILFTLLIFTQLAFSNKWVTLQNDLTDHISQNYSRCYYSGAFLTDILINRIDCPLTIEYNPLTNRTRNYLFLEDYIERAKNHKKNMRKSTSK